MRWSGRLAFALLTLVLSCKLVSAQATAQMSGTVRDSSGAVLPGVEITATQTETGVVRTTVTNETGSYVLPNLPVGPYRLEAVLPGFRTYVQTGIVLQINSNPVINATLEVGQVTEQVEVQANASLVETRNVGIGSVIENQRIVDLPLNGRNAADLIVLAGSGAVQMTGSSGGSMPGGLRISVAGSPAINGNLSSYASISYVLDGAVHINPWDGANLPFPFPDALQEFKVETSALTAQNGTHTGAAVNSVTKSGTNELHGDLFEFVRNGMFNARNFFATKRDTLKRNQFGGTLGGPIKKDKLFFFGGLQRTLTRSDPPQSIMYIPTAAMQAGDFTSFASPDCNGGRQLTLGAPYVGNRLDPALISKAALSLASRFPKTTDPCGKAIFGVADKPNELQAVGRLDYQWRANQSVFGRYIATTFRDPDPYTLADNVLVTGLTGGKDNLVQSVTLGDTYVIGPDMVNAFRFAGNRTGIHVLAKDFFSPVDLGVKNFYSYIQASVFTITGGFHIGEEQDTRYRTNTFQIVDDLSVLRGAHQMAFGGNVTSALIYTEAPKYAAGSFTFTGQETGLGLADFMAGKLGTLTQAAPFVLSSRQRYFSIYGQDTWKATPRLTLNYGIRWEPFLPLQQTNGHIDHFDYDGFLKGIHSTQYPNAPAGLFYPGDPGFPGKAGFKNQWKAFGPRVGLAWDPKGDGRTSVRAAYGKAYEFVIGAFHLNDVIIPPWSGLVTLTSPASGFDNPYGSLPGGNPFPVDPVHGLFTPNSNFGNWDYDTKPTNVQSWNLSIQRQIGTDWLVSTSYLGTKTTHLWTKLQQNPAVYLPGGPCVLNGATYNPCSTTGNTQQRRRLVLANPQQGQYFSTIGKYDSGGNASYNALQLSLQRRVSSGVSVIGNYTWSHCISDKLGADILDVNNRALDRGNCPFGRRQILNLTSVAQTPRFAKPALRAFASGWQLSGIYKLSTGNFLTVTSGADVALNGAPEQRPNRVLESPYGDRSSLNRYLNSAAFSRPANGTFGNMGRYAVAGPGFWQLDAALSRIFQVRETQRLEFRAEAFNLTNSLRRGDPAVNLLQGTFGQITTAFDPRIMQFALKYLF